ncbi:MAG: hypothetical protein GY757_45040 [bacterium]|nr:hypothetical protein [bacterium]
MRKKMGKRLSRELKVIQESTVDFVIPDPASIDKENIEGIIAGILELVEKESLTKLFQLGRYLERTLLSTFDTNKENHKITGIEKFKNIAETYKKKKKKIIIDGLDQLKKNTHTKKIRKIILKIKKKLNELHEL